MAKYRCPRCGASHNQRPANCRLCGQNMAPDAIVGDPVQTAAKGAGKSGLKGIVLIAIGVVLVLGIAALSFGLTRGDETVKKATDAIPLLSDADEDGWSRTTDPNFPCKMGVDFPGERTQETKNGVVSWKSTIGKDELLQVSCQQVPASEAKTSEQTLKEFLDAQAEADADALGGEVILTKEGGTGGVNGIYFEARYPMRNNADLIAKGADPEASSWVFGYYLLRGTDTQYLSVVVIDGISKEPVAKDRFLGSYQAIP